MSRFIEIQDGILIKVSDIEAIEKVGESQTKVYTHHRKYLGTFPFATLAALLGEDDTVDRKLSSDEIVTSTMKKLNIVLDKSQHFAG